MGVAWRLPLGAGLGAVRAERPAAPSARALGEAARTSERLLLLAFALVRAAIYVQSVVAAVVVRDHFTHPVVAGAILAVCLAESAVVVEASRRRGVFDNGVLVALDVATSVAALTVISLALRPGADPYMDDFLYPYTVASMSIVGLSLRRLPGVLLLTLVVTGTYAATTATRFGLGGPLLQNCLTYWAFSLVSWGLARSFRQLSRDLDQARDQTVAREVELKIERERARSFRDLHDRVLQTLETLGRGDWVSDARVRDHIAGEAAWLRERIEASFDHRGGDDLVEAVRAVVQRQRVAGLRVELHTAEMGVAAGAKPLCHDAGEALAGAADEALTNVRKHAGVASAVVRVARARDGVVVSVLDHGRGFDQARVERHVGIPESLVNRMRQVAGTARIQSAPGAGTYVELWAPCIPP